MPLEHARIPASSLDPLGACIGRLQAIEALPPEQRESPDTPASIDGTRRHDLVEWRFHNRDAPWPTEVNGKPISSDDVRAVTTAWEYVQKHPALKGELGHNAWAEQKVEIGKWCGLPEGLLWGTSDLFLVSPGEAEIVDYKFGHRPVSPGRQLKAYAVGSLSRLVDPATGVFHPAYRQTKRVRLTIIQPEDKEVVKSEVFPLEHVMQWAKDFKELVEAALKPGAPRTPGDKQCRYCPANATCPERLQSVATSVADMFEPIEVSSEMTTPKPESAPAPIASIDAITDITEQKMTEDPSTLTDEQLGKILDQAPLIEGWLKEVRKLAHQRVEADFEAGQRMGWKLIAGKRARKWNQDEVDTVAGLKKIGLTVAEIYEKKLVTPAAAVNNEKVHKTRKKEQQFEDLWSWKDGKPILAPESDPSPAINSPESMFEEITAPTAEPQPEPVSIPDWA